MGVLHRFLVDRELDLYIKFGSTTNPGNFGNRVTSTTQKFGF